MCAQGLGQGSDEAALGPGVGLFDLHHVSQFVPCRQTEEEVFVNGVLVADLVLYVNMGIGLLKAADDLFHAGVPLAVLEGVDKVDDRLFRILLPRCFRRFLPEGQHQCQQHADTQQGCDGCQQFAFFHGAHLLDSWFCSCFLLYHTIKPASKKFLSPKGRDVFFEKSALFWEMFFAALRFI